MIVAPTKIDKPDAKKHERVRTERANIEVFGSDRSAAMWSTVENVGDKKTNIDSCSK